MRLSVLVVTWLFLFGNVHVRAGGGLPQKSQVDELVAPFIESGELVGLAIGIVTPDGNHTLTYGRSSLVSDAPLNSETIFEIGSVTKVFTGVLLARMVHESLVTLDDPVKGFLPPDVKVGGVNMEEMTLRHLATHTAGLPRDPSNLRPKDPLNRFEEYTEEQLYASLSAVGANNETNALRYSYSSTGIGLLGHALARKSGISFEELLVEQILAPLKMSDTRISLREDQSARLADGYYYYETPAPHFFGGCIPACVALSSSTKDMLRFVEIHLKDGPTPLHSAALKASTPHFEANVNLSVGLCWHIDPRNDIVWHGGVTTGFTSAVAFHKDSGLGVVILSNSKSLYVTQLAGAVLGILKGNSVKPIPLRRRKTVETKKLDSYEGVFQDSSLPFLKALRSTRSVSRDGECLKVRGFSGEEFPIYPSGDNEFFCKGEDIEVVFENDEAGNVQGMELNLWGFKSSLKKVR